MSDRAAGMTSADVNHPRRKGRVILVISLAANLLLIGFLIGQMLHHPAREREGPMSIERLTGNMPPELRDAVRANLRAHRPQIVEKITAARAAQSEVHAAITANPFDVTRMQAAFAAIRERRLAVQEEVQAATVEALSTLPADIRQKLGR